MSTLCTHVIFGRRESCTLMPTSPAYAIGFPRSKTTIDVYGPYVLDIRPSNCLLTNTLFRNAFNILLNMRIFELFPIRYKYSLIYLTEINGLFRIQNVCFS